MATRAPLKPEEIRLLLRDARFLAADRAGVALADIATWDSRLLRESRLLVPVQVEALVVPPSGGEPMLRLPMGLAGDKGRIATRVEDTLPPPFAPGQPRPPGVHLHWALPDALLQGTLDDAASAQPRGSDAKAPPRNRLGLRPLPDRWLVLRLLLPRGASEVQVAGWVLEADAAVAVPLAQWKEGAAPPAGTVPAGAALTREQLIGTAGGTLEWTATYDAVLNRFALHDPLTDLPTAAPRGVEGNCASYLVCGWWSDPRLDPLDAARSRHSLDELLDALGWQKTRDWGDALDDDDQRRAEQALRDALGLKTGTAFDTPRPATRAAKLLGAPRAAGAVGVQGASSPAAASALANAPFAPLPDRLLKPLAQAANSAFRASVAEVFQAPPWQLRASLLHGAIHGVPTDGSLPVDRRPDAAQLSVALGHQEDDVLAALAAAGETDPQTRRATERLLAAFTSQKVNRLDAPDGLVEIEEREHAGGFASQPAGIAGDDRYLEPGQHQPPKPAPRDTTGAAGVKAASAFGNAAAIREAARSPLQASLVFDASQRPSLKAARSEDIGRKRAAEDAARPGPPRTRVVPRPAPRFTAATDPVLAVRGARRSLRHGHDGSDAANRKLGCRWPSQVIQELPGLIARDRFITSLGNGSLPPEILRLARETLLVDPYHHGWIAQAVAPAATGGPKPLLRRLQAESALRFGTRGQYDGATEALDPTRSAVRPNLRLDVAGAPPVVPGRRQHQLQVAQELRRFSLYAGVDPNRVAVTTWAQPWVPLWVEWEVQVEGIDPPSLAGWTLGPLDLDVPDTQASFDGQSLSLRGRTLLTSGGASTLHRAIKDFLAAEDRLDEQRVGLVDEDVETALRILDEAVERLDVVTAALAGLRAQLLGFEAGQGLRRPLLNGEPQPPAPTGPTHALLAGGVRLTRARLVDAFGRTLDVPVARVATPVRATHAARPGLLLTPPRLLRPARWLLRLVDAATPLGAEGSEARVDQVDAALQINPVCGYLLPDHLDESLELFGTDGAPLGELLHDAISGGVMWEIAAGRAGAADAGPLHGLAGGTQPLGFLAAGLVAADAHARKGQPASGESALSALLRAIDTTLWTVDSFSALGSEHVAGLVGRPMAVVRAQLRLELKPPDDVDLSNAAQAAAWAAAEAEAARHAFPVRIGELTRSDDGVLGFFVDDDFSRVRLVDKAIAELATAAGRSRGQLGLLGATAEGSLPAPEPLLHEYLAGRDEDDTLLLHLGQTVTLTVLMHPAGRLTLSSGLLPRKQLALARDWVAPGLAALSPSLRTGPLLVETDLDAQKQVRLPKLSVFGKDQNFLWRDTPATWRTDAILAATQTALLPDAPAEFRDGWIRVAPDAKPSSPPKG